MEGKMLNLRTDVPIKQDVLEAVQNRLAQQRDLSLEIEQMLKMCIDDEVLLTRSEVAKMLRCDEKKIPRAIPRMRVSSNYLFDKNDVKAFLESKKR